MIKYRPDIDGLRAIAVLPIVLFHFRVKGFDGGFVGVDIFFVISGFLITSIIKSEIEQNKFTFKNFYLRRAKRIIPAFLPVLILLSVYGFFKLLPDKLILLSKSIISTILFVSNFFFLSELDYFGPDAHDLHLLHMWSLSIEEQFYLLFPIFLLLISKFKKRVITFTTVFIFVLSLIASIMLINYNRQLTFYILPTRAWELLLGAIIVLIPGLISKKKNISLAYVTIGLGLILYSIFTYNSEILFPGFTAVPPTVGAGFIILGGTNAPFICRALLTNKFMVGVGKISYSMYLWHWPIAVILISEKVSKGTYFWCFIFLIVISYISYRYIEQPFRKTPNAKLKNKAIAGCVTIIIILSFGIISIDTEGMMFRLPQNAIKLAKYSDYEDRKYIYGGECFSEANWNEFPISECLIPKPGKRSILIWGDSVGAHYVHGLKLAAQGTDFDIIQACAGGCPAALDLDPQKISRPYCKERNNAVHAYIVEHPPSLVVLTGQWRSHSKYYKPFLEQTIKTLVSEGIKVIVLGPPIKYNKPLPEILIKNIFDGKATKSKEYFDQKTILIDHEMRDGTIDMSGAKYISIIQLMCNGLDCPLTMNDVPLQWDAHHLTREGSELVGRKLFPILETEANM